MADGPVLVLDDDVTPTVVVQNDLIRYLFADDDEDEWPTVTVNGKPIIGELDETMDDE